MLVYTQWANGLCQESLSVCWSTHNGLLGFVRRVYQFVGLHTMGYWALSGESISLLVYTQWATGLCQESLSVCWSTHNGLLGFVRRVYQFVGRHTMGYWALSGEFISVLVYTQTTAWATGLCQEGRTFFIYLLTEHIYGYMVSVSQKGNPLSPHRLRFLISSKGSFICIIPQTG